MKIQLMSVYVDDQEKALRFYAEVLGFAKKADFSNGLFRWLTVASPEEPNGPELQLALNSNPTACFSPTTSRRPRAHQGPRRRVHDAASDVTASTIAMLNDTCGNLIQITPRARY